MILKPSNKKQVFSKMWASSFNEYHYSKLDPKRVFNLRISQLPYCPANTLFNWAQRGMSFAESMEFDYYVSIGTAVHNTVQKFLPKVGKILSNYECHECGKKYPMSYKTECCGFYTKFKEIEIKIGKIVGHIDGVWNVDGQMIPLDYKTTSIKRLKDAIASPPIQYVRQLHGYAVGLKELYGIESEEAGLVFIPRDDPHLAEIRIMQLPSFEIMENELNADLELHKKTVNATTAKEIKNLLSMSCKNEYCTTCKIPIEDRWAIVKKHGKKFSMKKFYKENT